MVVMIIHYHSTKTFNPSILNENYTLCLEKMIVTAVTRDCNKPDMISPSRKATITHIIAM